MATTYFRLLAEIVAHNRQRQTIAPLTTGGRIQNVQRAKNPRCADGYQVGRSWPST
ncbi:Uncharacterised protein [Salmonella enterica subsp. enterica serovar Bovismorbificans]|uniref:Uncharacterized protein n=1 Tax=Salmonella enterica subsp. enterica serovar Bovismorbificans TaxID=58097 RepID=A0A655D4R6_SALET|nr:Uncharacterised protein [Salmonella enterica subsp. enterica serovar Bovismorbificans]